MARCCGSAGILAQNRHWSAPERSDRAILLGELLGDSRSTVSASIHDPHDLAVLGA